MTTYEQITEHLKSTGKNWAELARLSNKHPRNLGRTVKTTIERLNKILAPSGIEIYIKKIEKI